MLRAVAHDVPAHGGDGPRTVRADDTANGGATRRRPDRWTVGLVFASTLVVYLLAAVRMLPYVEPPTGDQPHYLMQVISLVEDGDLDLKNNYTSAESYGQFSAPGRRRPGFQGIPVSYQLEPAGHVVVKTTADGERWYPKHAPGLPVLLVPGWSIGKALTPWLSSLTALGSGSWPGAVIEMAVFGALLATQIFLLAWDASGRRSIAFAVWGALSFSVPQLLVSLTLFPEAPAALGLVCVFRHVAVRPLPSQTWKLMLLGAIVAGLPWLNPRLMLVSGSLALLVVVALWRAARTAWTAHAIQRAETRATASACADNAETVTVPESPLVKTLAIRATCLLGPLALSTVALVWYHLAVFGGASAVADQYEGFFVPTVVNGQITADWYSFLVAGAGLFVDRQYGLLVFSPVYALAIAGLGALWQSPAHRPIVVALAVAVVPYVALTADFRVWWGGWSPPARYLAVVAPLMAAPMARALLALVGVRLHWTLFAILAGVGLIVTLSLLVQLGNSQVEQPIFSNPSRNPAALRWLLLQVGIDLTPLLPGTAAWFGDRRGPVPWLQISACLALVGLLVGLAARALPDRPKLRRFLARRLGTPSLWPARPTPALEVSQTLPSADPPGVRSDTRR